MFFDRGILGFAGAALAEALSIPIDSTGPIINSSIGTFTPANWSPSCVNTAHYSEWAGNFHFNDCASAFLKLKRTVAPYADEQRTFFSRELVPAPPVGGWGLPSGISNGSCAVFARMAEDFGDHTLPLMVPGPLGPYLPTGLSSPTEVTDWDTITAVMADLIEICVIGNIRPGWAIRRSDIVVVVAPLDSDFRRRWWPSDVELNGTESNGMFSVE